ncbi:MAG: ATP-binding protein [Phormidesmis sp.]
MYDSESVIPALETQSVNAAIVNISGRQRMLSQRAAMLSLMLVGGASKTQRTSLRKKLQTLAALMKRSHEGLIYGDAELHLPGQPSATVHAMYFDPPLTVDRQVRDYLSAIQAFLQLADSEMTMDSASLQAITNAALSKLLSALDAIVTQYQVESEAEQALIKAQQMRLYQERCAAAEKAELEAARSHQALAKLRQTQVQLVQSEKMSGLGQLVAGIAHEINNPVSFIQGNVSHAQDYFQGLLDLLHTYQQCYPQPASEIETVSQEIDLTFIQSDLPRLLLSMKTGSDRIRSIVLALRSFSRLDESELKSVNIHEGLDNSLLILRHRLENRLEQTKIQVVRDYADLPPVECFAGAINQVFMNVLTNAIDAIDGKGNSQLNDNHPDQIVLRTTLLQNQWVKISIADSGCGIPEEIQPRIFEPFFTTKPVGAGTGMGLSISYQIITEKHQGKLTYFSSPEGTEFTIQIPMRL